MKCLFLYLRIFASYSVGHVLNTWFCGIFPLFNWPSWPRSARAKCWRRATGAPMERWQYANEQNDSIADWFLESGLTDVSVTQSPAARYIQGESLVHQWNSKEREILGEREEGDRLKAFPTELKEAIPLLVSYREDQDQQGSEWSLLLELGGE